VSGRALERLARARRRRRRLAAAGAFVLAVSLGSTAALLVRADASTQPQTASEQSTAYRAYLACQGVSGQIGAAGNTLRLAGERVATFASTKQALGSLDAALAVAAGAPALDDVVRSSYAAARQRLTGARATYTIGGVGGVPAMLDTLAAIQAIDAGLCAPAQP
jgi:hypothetical protein